MPQLQLLCLFQLIIMSLICAFIIPTILLMLSILSSDVSSCLSKKQVPQRFFKKVQPISYFQKGTEVISLNSEVSCTSPSNTFLYFFSVAIKKLTSIINNNKGRAKALSLSIHISITFVFAYQRGTLSICQVTESFLMIRSQQLIYVAIQSLQAHYYNIDHLVFPFENVHFDLELFQSISSQNLQPLIFAGQLHSRFLLKNTLFQRGANTAHNVGFQRKTFSISYQGIYSTFRLNQSPWCKQSRSGVILNFKLLLAPSIQSFQIQTIKPLALLLHIIISSQIILKGQHTCHTCFRQQQIKEQSDYESWRMIVQLSLSKNHLAYIRGLSEVKSRRIALEVVQLERAATDWTTQVVSTPGIETILVKEVIANRPPQVLHFSQLKQTNRAQLQNKLRVSLALQLHLRHVQLQVRGVLLPGAAPKQTSPPPLVHHIGDSRRQHQQKTTSQDQDYLYHHIPKVQLDYVHLETYSQRPLLHASKTQNETLCLSVHLRSKHHERRVQSQTPLLYPPCLSPDFSVLFCQLIQSAIVVPDIYKQLAAGTFFLEAQMK